jgi:hypothetical protein
MLVPSMFVVATLALRKPFTAAQADPLLAGTPK